MSQSYVLDTSVLLHLIRGKEVGARIDSEFQLRASIHRHVVSIVTEAELWVLADRNQWGADKVSALRHALDNLVVVPIDGPDLVTAYVSVARADRAVHRGALNLGKNDVWIAATAVYTQFPLLTTDKDFGALTCDGLKVHWIDPAHA